MITFHRRFAVLAAATCLAVTGGCSTGMGDLPPLESTGAVEVKLAPGDKVSIVVQDLDTMSGEYIIDETGSVSLPLVDRVDAAGLSYVEMQRAIAAQLVAADVLKNPNVTVQPLELRPIYIMGEVRRPGEYAFRQGLTVFAAVSMAGGYTYRARTDEVAVTRIVNDQPTTAVATEDSVILPGDRIRVYERWF
ncbi:MAG: polysaccharide biosynthesis/export family protein [Erythrobacter sp.]|uniref:polysaccharide biosynthesis/export family protein n=1 Tax=Erythrobacter sp. TaxID=1042 RepID=UPI0026135DFF|nr:polysaccharide biosynthesis/export family protein [Erythrobacter sp.]MDJ0978690.1 polysaccharide biosynthesis/export family protein [Erythrobacter sp.]